MKCKYVDIEGLGYYHKLLMKHINELIVNRAFEHTNCPNCGAVIVGDKCDFCGTIFKENGYERSR